MTTIQRHGPESNRRIVGGPNGSTVAGSTETATNVRESGSGDECNTEELRAKAQPSRNRDTDPAIPAEEAQSDRFHEPEAFTEVVGPPRQVAQIAAAHVGYVLTLFAIAGDGTMWRLRYADERGFDCVWEPLPPIPGVVLRFPAAAEVARG